MITKHGKENTKIYKTKIVKTGSPRIDLWRRDVYPKIFREDINKLKAKYGKFLFIPSTFYTSNSDLKKAISKEKQVKNDETLFSLNEELNKQNMHIICFKFIHL